MPSDKAILQRAQSLQNTPKILFSLQKRSHVLKASELSLLFSSLIGMKDLSEKQLTNQIKYQMKGPEFVISQFSLAEL